MNAPKEIYCTHIQYCSQGEDKWTRFTGASTRQTDGAIKYINAANLQDPAFLAENGLCRVGLKDHEIQELVNAVRDNLQCLDDLVNMGPLREMISSAVTKYLESKNLRIDKPSPPEERE